MSCTVSQETRIMLAELLAEEKEDTRNWLRDEMDRLVDSMFHRLTHKLMMNADWDGSDHAKVVNPSDHVESLIPLPSNSLNLTQSQLIIFQQQHDPNVIHYQLPNDSFPIGINYPVIHSNENNIQSNHHQQSELDQFLVQPQPTLIFPNAQMNFDLHLNEPPLNESVLENEEYNENFDCYEEEEGECYCDECVGVIEIEQEQVEVDDDDSGSVQLIENDDDDQEAESESTLPVKRPRMESNPPNKDHQQSEVVRLSPTDEAQKPNQANSKHYITVHLQCPLSECPATFPEDQLAQHLLDAHSIGPFRCLVKDCKQAFDDSAFLKQHRLQSHQSITEWHCDACDKHYPSYDRLSLHCQQHHQYGLFQCSFPACPFTGEYRQKVSTHYSKQHRQPTKCCHCPYATADPSNLRRHERGHLGIKPYRCSWTNCHYSSAYQPDTLKHIRTQHLAAEVDQQSVDPKNYLEVASELLT